MIPLDWKKTAATSTQHIRTAVCLLLRRLRIRRSVRLQRSHKKTFLALALTRHAKQIWRANLETATIWSCIKERGISNFMTGPSLTCPVHSSILCHLSSVCRQLGVRQRSLRRETRWGTLGRMQPWLANCSRKQAVKWQQARRGRLPSSSTSNNRLHLSANLSMYRKRCRRDPS